MDSNKVDLYLWQEGTQYDLETHNDKLVENCLKNFFKKKYPKEKELRLTSPIFEIECHITGDVFCINHFRIYEENKKFGTKILNLIEKIATKTTDTKTIQIQLGTESGKEKTLAFLEKNNYDIINIRETKTHGEIVIGNKSL